MPVRGVVPPPTQRMVWLVVGMALFRSLGIVNVLRHLAEGLGMQVSWKGDPEATPRSTTISRARDRLGWEVVRRIFRVVADSWLPRRSGATQTAS